MTVRRLGLGVLALGALAGCHEYRAVSPFALPPVADMANHAGRAQTFDVQGDTFQVERGFDVAVEPTSDERSPAFIDGPVAASIDRGALWIRGKDDPLPRRFELGAVKSVGVKRVSAGKTMALAFGLGGGVATVVTTLVVIAASIHPTFAVPQRSSL